MGNTLALSTWNTLAAAKALAAFVGVAVGETGSDIVAASVLEVVSPSVKSAVVVMETVGRAMVGAVEAALALLLAKTAETAEVLVGADIAESAEAVMDASSALESAESWSVPNVGLDAVEA